MFDPFGEIMGFAPRPQREGDFPVSRDWADIDCKATGCMYNQCEKCTVPSRCNIGANGRCSGFEARKTPTKVDGD